MAHSSHPIISSVFFGGGNLTSRLNVSLLYIGYLSLCGVLFYLGANLATGATIDNNQGMSHETQQPEAVIDISSVVAEPVVEEKVESVDEIALKQKEMRDTTVLVKTRRSSGSGTIIYRLETEIKQLFEYLVLTNAHITYSRFVEYLRGVDSITGRVEVEVVDTGCGIITFDYSNKYWDNHIAEVVAEDSVYDLAILSFVSKRKLAVAKIADYDMLEQVRVFDDVFAIGCQLGRAPSPTVGIISQILIGLYGDEEWIVYSNTAQITPGSSGGGLFKKYDGHYYLIGVPYRIAIANNGQMIPHMSQAISIKTAREFIDQNSVTCP